MIQHYRNKNVWITTFGFQGFSKLVGSFVLGRGQKRRCVPTERWQKYWEENRTWILATVDSTEKKILLANSAYLPKYLLKILPRETNNFSHLQLIQDEVGTFFTSLY